MNDVEVAVAAALAGADVVRARFGGPLTRVAKSPTDFATEADLDAERAILEVIRRARPDDAFLGEEAGLVGSALADRTWLVDPLCGTLNFAAQTPLVAVNVALRAARTVPAAAVAAPFADTALWTDGHRAHRRRGDHDEIVAPSPDSRLVDIDFNTDPAFAAALASAPAYTARFGTRVVSTSLALAWVADGRRAGYVQSGDVRDSVHFAAGIAVCLAAGCLVTGLAGQPVWSDGGGLLAAADRETHEALLQCIAEAT